MKQLVSSGILAAIFGSKPFVVDASTHILKSSALLVTRHSSSQDRHGEFPMPVIEHQKKAGGGYLKDSPLYQKQKAWRSSYGKNVMKGTSSPNDSLFSNIPEQFRPVWIAFYTEPWLMLALTVFHVLLLVAVAALYRRYKRSWFPLDEPKYPTNRDGQESRMKILFCWGGWRPLFGDDASSGCRILCCACFCPLIRWADTTDQMMKGKFWHAFALMLILALIGPFTFGVSVLISLCVGIYFRQKIRAAYDNGAWKATSLAQDVFCWCFCTPIAIAQEANEVEKVKRDR